MRRAISWRCGVSVSSTVWNQASALLIERSDASAMCLPGDLHRERLGLEARAVADRAGLLRLVARHLLAHPDAVALLPAALQVAQHALERLVHGVGAHAVLVGEGDLLLAAAVEDRVAHLLRQLAPRRAGAHLEVAREALQRLVVIGALRPRPGRDRALRQACAARPAPRAPGRRRSRRRGRRRPGRRRAAS